MKPLAKAARAHALEELRSALAREVRQRRVEEGLSQTELAARMGSSQPRVAHLEAGDSTLDLLCNALFALGVDREAIAKVISKAA